VIPIHQPGEGGPRPDPQKRALLKIMELSRTDFPGQKLVIGVDGSLSGK